MTHLPPVTYHENPNTLHISIQTPKNVIQRYTWTKQSPRCLFKYRYSSSAVLQRLITANLYSDATTAISPKFTHELNHFSWFFPERNSLLTRFSSPSNSYSVTRLSSQADTSVKAVIKFQYNRTRSPVCASPAFPIHTRSFIPPSWGIEYSNMAAA